jgi:hypothetical protein
MLCHRSDPYEHSGPYWATLHDDTSLPPIGHMHLCNYEQLCQSPTPEDAKADNTKASTRSIEVVAINRVVEFLSKENGEGDPLLRRKEYVTVLWVKWEGVVAYRQACGRVQRKAWESLELEKIDLVLG